MVSKDFNDDGNNDLALQASGIFIMLGNGDGTFQGPVTYQIGTGTQNLSSIFSVDIDGDGYYDLATITTSPSSYTSSYTASASGVYKGSSSWAKEAEHHIMGAITNNTTIKRRLTKMHSFILPSYVS